MGAVYGPGVGVGAPGVPGLPCTSVTLRGGPPMRDVSFDKPAVRWSSTGWLPEGRLFGSSAAAGLSRGGGGGSLCTLLVGFANIPGETLTTSAPCFLGASGFHGGASGRLGVKAY